MLDVILCYAVPPIAISNIHTLPSWKFLHRTPNILQIPYSGHSIPASCNLLFFLNLFLFISQLSHTVYSLMLALSMLLMYYLFFSLFFFSIQISYLKIQILYISISLINITSYIIFFFFLETILVLPHVTQIYSSSSLPKYNNNYHTKVMCPKGELKH